MEKSKVMKKRFWEIDALRGSAVLMMIWFHLLFDLSYFGLMEINVETGFWRIFGYLTAVLFVFIAGVSVFISSERSNQRLSKRDYCLKFLRRGFFLLLLGLFITAATWVFAGDGYIVFGILSLIGISVLLSPFFVRLHTLNFFIGIFVIITGLFISKMNGPYFMIPFGLTPNGFYSLDYEPLFPWFGVFLLGISAGSYFYGGEERRFSNIKILIDKTGLKRGFLEYFGRHSLAVYLIHQPVIILILSALAGRILI